jgi:hypothetical protein
MAPRKKLPKKFKDRKGISVSFPRLSPDSPRSCPLSIREIMEYVRVESADLEKAKRKSLVFLRTAEVGEYLYWLWRFTESNGEECYVTVQYEPNCTVVIGLTGSEGLSPEEYLRHLQEMTPGTR